MAHLLFMFICLVWGSSFMLMKHSLLAFGPVSVGAGRVLLGAVALTLFWQVKRRPWRIQRRDWPALVLVAGVGYALPFSLQPLVIEHVEASTGHGSTLVGLMVALVPLFTVLASVPMLGIRPTRRQLAGVLGGLVFVALLFVDEWRQDVAAVHLLMGIATPLCYAVVNTYVKRRFNTTPAVVLAALTLGLAGAMLLPLSLGLEPIALEHEQFATAAAALVVLGLVSTGLAHCLFYVLIHRKGPLFAGMVAYVIPCVAMVAGWLFGETLTLWHVACLLGILSMVWLVQSKPAAQAASATAETAAMAAEAADDDAQGRDRQA